MTLHEAIKQVLENKDKSMTPQEIADELNGKSLYQKQNGNDITGSDVSLRVKNYPELFNITISLVR